MDLLRRFYQQQIRRPRAYSLVDIGRDTVKAVVVLAQADGSEPQVVGWGLAETGGRDVTGGRLEAAAVTSPVNIALTQAEDSTEAVVGKKIVPDDVIFALAGQATTGQLFTVRQMRPDPARPVSAKELKQVRRRAERLARQGLARLPVEGGQWQALAVNDAGVRLDRRLVLDGVGLTGSEITFSIFGVAAQAGAWRALETLANRLDLVIANIVAAPQALASVAPHPEAIVLDTGLSGTTVCLIRDDALTATGWVPFGGGFFTKSLAHRLEIKPDEARKLKHALTDGDLTRTEADYLNDLLDEARYRWYQAVMNLLANLSSNKPLPWKIYLTGGGNLLPGLDLWLRSDPAAFVRAPDVSRLEQRSLAPIKNLEEGLDYDLFCLALSLMVGAPQGDEG